MLPIKLPRSVLLIIYLFVFIFSTSAYSFTLVGTYKLVSVESQNNNGKWVSDCPSPTGLLTYTSDGYMAVGLNCMKSENSKEPSMENQDMTFYTGKYIYKDNTIIHFVENSSNINLYKKELIRKVTVISNHQMMLLATTKSGEHIRLTWEKIT